MEEVVFTSMKHTMLFVDVSTILQESSVKVSELEIFVSCFCQEMLIVCYTYINANVWTFLLV